MRSFAFVVVSFFAANAYAQEDLSARSLNKVGRAKNVSERLSGLRAVCNTIRPVNGNELLYKSEISPHITSGDVRASGPTLVCGKVCPASWPADLYYSDGTLAAKLGYYSVWNVTGRPRAYCGAGGAPACSNSTLVRESRRRGRDGQLYLQTSAKKSGTKTVCYRVWPLGRTGSPQ
jgi:hypothetical protein